MRSASRCLAASALGPVMGQATSSNQADQGDTSSLQEKSGSTDGPGAGLPLSSSKREGTDFSKVNSLRSNRVTRQRSPSLSKSAMYQSLRSYVGKNAKLPGYMDYLHLSTADVAILKGSWSVLEDHVARVGVEFFLDIVTNHEEIRDAFRQNPSVPQYEVKANEDLYRHGMFILGSIRKIVNKIDDTEYLEKLFDDLSDKHRSIGIEANGMDIFGKVFCKVMRPILLDKRKWKPEIKDSWMTFFSSIVKVMKKSETKAEKEQQDQEDQDHKGDLKHQVFRRNTFDRHLIEVGCESFTQLFSHFPMLDHFATYNTMVIEGTSIGEALRCHAAAIGSVVAEIQEHAGNPERIRMSLAHAGQRRYLEGVDRQHLDMLGPVLSHVIRPLVWEKGLWSIEVEKAWTHLFDIVACLMKLGYPQEFEEDEIFPNLTEVVILRDTWDVIQKQIKAIGNEAFEKIFGINSDMNLYANPDQKDSADPDELKETTERLKENSVKIVLLVERVVSLLPSMTDITTLLSEVPEAEISLLDVVGPVFCNATRHFLLVNGRWSLDVENAWLSLFRELALLMRPPSSSQSSKTGSHNSLSTTGFNNSGSHNSLSSQRNTQLS